MSIVPPTRPLPIPLRGFAEAGLMIAAATLAGLALSPHWGTSAVDLLFLPAVLATAAYAGLRPALFGALAAAGSYNFFFTAPRFTFHVDNPNDVVTVVVLFAVAIVTSQLAASVRRQAEVAKAHAARNATIAGLARALLPCSSEADVAQVGVRRLSEIFQGNAVLVAGLPQPRRLAAYPESVVQTPGDLAVAAMVLETGERAGRGVDRAVPSEWQFHPVHGPQGVIAAFGCARDDGTPPVPRDQLPLLASLLDQLALALERGRLEREASEFARLRERDQVRSVLLASIGDELTPPIRALGEGVNELRRSGDGEKGLLSALAAELAKLQRYLANLLDLEPDTDRGPVQAGAVVIDLFRRTVARDGLPVHLAPKEYAVLAELARHPGRVLTHAHLLRTAWGPAQEGQIDYLRVAIRGLRQKLENDPAHPRLILNEPAVGYRLSQDPAVASAAGLR